VVIAEADWAGIYSFIKPLVVRLSRYQRVHCALVTRDDQALSLAWDLASTRRFGRWNWSVWPYSWLDDFPGAPRLIVSCQPFSGVAHRFSDPPKIQTLHGMADKRGELFGTDKLRDFTHLFSMGPFVTRLAESRLLDRTGAPPLRIVATGCPKTDELLDGTWQRQRVLQDLGMRTGRPTVLYAPTWEKTASLERLGPEIIARLCRLPINVLVKPHHLSLADPNEPFCVAHGHDGKNWRRILAGYERRFENLRWVKHASANPAMVAADVLVTDGSGIGSEYVLLDRPLVFVSPITSGTDTPPHQRYDEYGEVVQDAAGLEQAVRCALAEPQAKQAARQRLARDIAYNPGRATAVAMGEISRLLDGHRA
jgi:hypothetical protein